MSTICRTCTEPIVSAEFIKCEGICTGMFHSKCVSLNKTTLNAITCCPNAHWLCNECNIGGKSIGASIDNMRTAVDSLTKSLSGDLLSGFKMLTDTLATSIASIHRSATSPDHSNQNPKKRRREDTSSVSECQEGPVNKKKHFGRVEQSGHNLVATGNLDDRRKSIVVSNIDKGITADDLTKYLASELCIEESVIKTTLLKPARLTESDIKFLQFRVSVPLNIYDAVRSPQNWPVGVKIRDYIFRQQVNRKSVPIESFLSKRNCQSNPPRESDQTAPVSPVTTESASTTENRMDTIEIESPVNPE